MLHALVLSSCLVAAGDALRQEQDPLLDRQIAEWIEKLTDPYELVRHEARESIEKAGLRAESHLIEALNHPDYRVRKVSLEILTKWGSRKAVDKAIAIFKSPEEDRYVQAAAFRYLERCGKDDVEDLMIGALESPEAEYRKGAVEALMRMKSARCAEKAAALYEREQDREIKEGARELLQSIGDPAKPHLFRLLNATDSDVRLGAVKTLRGMGAPASELMEPFSDLLRTESDERVARESFEVLEEAGAAAERHLLECLKARLESARLRSLDALTELKSERAIEPVAELFESDANEKVRRRSRDFLVAVGLKAEDAFIRALDNAHPKVRLSAIEALGEIRSEKMYERISKLYGAEPDEDVRRACFAYFEKVGIKAEPELLAALKDESLDIRLRAIRALGYAQSAKAIEPLMGLLAGDNADVRQAALDALATIGPKAVDAIPAAVRAGALRKEDADEIRALYYQSGVERIMEGLVSDQGKIGSYASQFAELAKFGKERAVPVLLKMIRDPGYRFRSERCVEHAEFVGRLALMALGEIGDASVLEDLRRVNILPEEDRYMEYVLALHRLGDEAPLKQHVERELKEGERLVEGDERYRGYAKLFAAALLQARVGKLDDALKAYLRLIELMEGGQETGLEDYAAALYNVACLHARKGDKAASIQALTRAVDAGFRDLSWILRDRDLDSIRGEEGYKKLVGDEARFKSQ
ncbi:MAG: HEAT repeat domain-containing protein [Planctomycetes bacterium]|nr:HEAT repeat domain-containing protein [Planctomycetota bacterium]